MANVQQVPSATGAAAPPAGNGAAAIPATTRVRSRPRTKPVVHLSVAERAAIGKAARAVAFRSGDGEWAPARDRRDPLELLEEQAVSRVRELVPIRCGRMLVSPFTSYRGAAYPMAADLAEVPQAIAAYLGSGDSFDRALATFAEACADRNERDYDALQEAVAAERLVAETGF